MEEFNRFVGTIVDTRLVGDDNSWQTVSLSPEGTMEDWPGEVPAGLGVGEMECTNLEFLYWP